MHVVDIKAKSILPIAGFNIGKFEAMLILSLNNRFDQ